MTMELLHAALVAAALLDIVVLMLIAKALRHRDRYEDRLTSHRADIIRILEMDSRQRKEALKDIEETAAELAERTARLAEESKRDSEARHALLNQRFDTIIAAGGIRADNIQTVSEETKEIVQEIADKLDEDDGA